jgi:transposase-like protein
MIRCPHCHQANQQVKCGRTAAGSQLYKCKLCHRKYTPVAKVHGYPSGVRRKARRLIATGYSLRQTARTLGVSHASIINWLKA